MRYLCGLLVLALTGSWACSAVVPVDNMESPALYTPAQPELGHKWTGEVALDRQEFKEGQGALRFRIGSARSGEESYPQFARSFDPAQTDWRPYGALRYWVKVTSDNPDVTFKNMCVVVYNGDSPFQQFQTHQVPVGRWVQLTDSLIDYNRDRVRGIIIYLYETDPAAQDNYTWWVDGLELEGLEAGQAGFDRLAVQPERRAAAQPLQKLATTEGLRLSLDATGRVAGLRLGAKNLGPTGRQVSNLSGLLVRDWSRGEEIVTVSGPVARQGGALVQTAAPLPGLSLRAEFTAKGERLHGHVTVRDRTGADRPLTLYFALPLREHGWTWWDDINTRRLATGRSEYFNNPTGLRSPRVSAYPFSCVSNRDAALSLATPLEPARLQRTTFNAELGVLYLAWDFCLSPAATKQGPVADFTFELYPCDPQWGFRSAAQRYYGYYPEYFTKRVPRDGGWVCWGSLANDKFLADSGFAYHWGPDPRGGTSFADSVKTDNGLGVLSLPYIEFTNMHVSMEGYEQAGSKEIMERVNLLADPQRTTPLPPLSYLFPYNSDYFGPDRDGFLRQVFQAYRKSLIFDPAGRLYGGADKGEFSTLIAKYIPFNADPDIPGGAGDFFLRQFIPQMERMYAAAGAQVDGFGWDNFYVRGTALDYRREHFAYADAPLSFDPVSLKPAILKDMSTYELQREVAAYLRARGRYLIANQCAVSPVAATLPLLDIFGYEWNIESASTYARTMARTKPVCSLPCAPPHYEEPYVNAHLLHACWPGGYYGQGEGAYLNLLRRYVPIIRRLNEAGWEPLPLARATPEAVLVERYGGTDGRPLLLTVRNPGAAAVTATVRLEQPLSAGKAVELLSGQALEVTQDAGVTALQVAVPAQWTVAVAVD